MEISITKTTTPKQKPADESKLGFGQYYTDHMFIMNYDEGEGWHNQESSLTARLNLILPLWYFTMSQEIFEGMKAYRTADGSIQLFRPDKNMARMNVSCDRLCIPKIDEEFAIKAIRTLVEVDKDWVPSLDGTSLYIRPYIFATDAQVGVHPAKHLTFAIILSPVGAYYPQGIAPVKIFVEQKYVRAVIGGTGFTKAGANYAISLKGQEEAAEQGYVQTLWLDGVERKYVEEVGSMNVFFKIDGEVVTPALVGSILGGITRMSIIELLQSKGYKFQNVVFQSMNLLRHSKQVSLKRLGVQVLPLLFHLSANLSTVTL